MMIADADAAVPGLSAPDSGATDWVLTASALVLFMTLPGLTLFYGGLVRTDQLPAVLMRRCFVISLDVFGVHGLGGMLGSLLSAAFALPALGGSGYGHQMSAAGQLGAQAIGVAAAAAWSAICTYVLVKLLDATVGARVSLEEERYGFELVSRAE